MESNYREPANPDVIKQFLANIDFTLPPGFIAFYEKSNGGDFFIGERCLVLWQLENLVELNQEYDMDEYAPNFFAFGTNGGNEVYCIEKATGDIYELPFIIMLEEDAWFVAKSIKELFLT